MATVILPGRPEMRPASETIEGSPFRALDPELKAAVRVDGVRGDTAVVPVTEVADDDIVEIELDGGVRLWQSVAATREDFGVDLSRGEQVAGVLLPTSLSFGRRERGAAAWAVKGLRIFGVDPVKGAAGLAAKELAEKIESKLRPGLYLCRAVDGAAVPLELAKPGTIPTDRPILLFIHGTGSSTVGSFSGLAEGAQRAQWDELVRAYDGHVYALEHRTLSVGPLQNAIELIEALPEGAHLHIVSHSRGGLVGEIVARGSIAQPQAFDATDTGILDKDEKQSGRSRAADKKALERLNDLFARKRPSVEKFIRVACPARGTTLASGRLDRYFSIVLNILGLIPTLKANPVYDLMAEFLAAFVKTRADPDTIPGLEAQMPESPLIAILNRPDLELPSGLAVIAGDIEGSGIFGSLKVFATDIFYWADHDLVVDTDAMSGGARRNPPATRLFDQGPSVSHFSYFLNRKTRQALVDALLGDPAKVPEFAEVKPAVREPFPMLVKRGGADLPVVFVLPGIMGTHLALQNNRIWLDYLDIAFGRLEELRGNRPGIRPEEPIGNYYGKLSKFLTATHEVVPFPFDWRLSIRDEGRRFGAEVLAALSRTQKPVRIIAHSFGGLVVRSMIAQMSDVWDKLQARAGSRFVMLGTPNGGAVSLVSTLLGRERTIKQLKLLDLRHNMEELLGIIASMPGPLELLPLDEDEKYLKLDAWQELKAADARGWVVPREEFLKAARESLSQIRDQKLNPSLTCYVAGVADETPVAIRIDRNARDKIKVLVTAEGDGRVTWATGIPDNVPTWFMNVSHGDLANHAPAFEAILDLLQRGTTTLLPRERPRAARGPAGYFERAVDFPRVYPSEDDLLRSVMGAQPVMPVSAAPRTRCRVTIAHGDLRFAQNPVAVGHYIDDPLLGAERSLNQCLNGRLARIRDLGLYPGRNDTCEIVLDPDARPQGAIVIGLGRYGELFPAHLTSGFSKAMLHYALESDEPLRARERAGGDGTLGVSTLIIGAAGATNITVRDSVEAILNGVAAANAMLRDKPITELQFIEVFEDTAIEAAAVLRDAAKDPRFNSRFEIDHLIKPIAGRRRRHEFGAQAEWWQRITVRSDPEEAAQGAKASRGGLVFTAITESARASESLVAPQRVLVDRLIEGARANTRTNREIGRLLFEMLLPRAIKAYASDERRLMLVVDEKSAAYPWELLDNNPAPAMPVDDDDDAGPRNEAPTIEPLVVRAPAIRQLVQGEAEGETLQRALSNAALVVGDPKSSFAELKGAQAEAAEVANLLRSQSRRQVTHLDRPEDGLEVLSALMLRQNGIVHLAGHGVYDYGDDHAIGMVIGDGQFLTAAEIRNMSYVPEFVFINCCHLGRIDGEEDKPLWQRRYGLAANLATQFIRSGARAVIAAGWAVDDGAATTFAREFYGAMLAGETFGIATHLARRAAYEAHPDVNTWGAYQCYGDPDYTFVREGMRRGAAARSAQLSAIGQAVIKAENIAESARSSNGAARWLKRELDELLDTIPKDWLNDATLLSAVGRAYAAIDDATLAVKYYGQAIEAEDAAAPIAALEQLVSFRARQAAAQAREARAEGKTAQSADLAARTAIADAIGQLEALSSLAGKVLGRGDGLSVERLCLIGGAYRQLARFERSAKARQAALARTANAYRTAVERARARDAGNINAPAVLNWITAAVLGTGEAPRAARELLETIERMAEGAVRNDPDGSPATLLIEARVVRALMDPQADRAALGREIRDRIQTVLQRSGASRQTRGVLDNLAYLSELVGRGMSGRDTREGGSLALWLDDLSSFAANLATTEYESARGVPARTVGRMTNGSGAKADGAKASAKKKGAGRKAHPPARSRKRKGGRPPAPAQS